MKLNKSLKMVFTKVLIFLDLHIFRNKDLESRLSYGSEFKKEKEFASKRKK